MNTVEHSKKIHDYLLSSHVTEVVALLSLQPQDSPVHNVEAYHDGIRVPVQLTDLTVYVYCLPWARGWSIFASPDANVAIYDWRFQTKKWRCFQMPVYSPRYLTGPHSCSPCQIVAALVYITRRLSDLERRRAPQIRAREKAL